MKEKVKARSYTLWDEKGHWLGQIVLTDDGMFASVTDWGNLSYSWRSYNGDFREFMVSINTDYFATKLNTGMAYIAHSRNVQKACQRFAEKILPPLQKILKDEVENNVPW